ncbi:glycosyltransferase family 4 protein [Amylibacter sp.]|nr:glycosyltransferase family 4 protein [Amylibacter sp.]
MHILITVNAAWNVLNFRGGLVAAMITDGHSVTVLAPRDDSVVALESLGCKVLPLEMSVKGLNPLQDIKLIGRMRKVFCTEQPDAIFSYTIKNNIFGALAARPLGIPFIPNVTGLGTSFLSGGFLKRIAEGLYRRAFRNLGVIFFQNEDDRNLFLERRLVIQQQGRLLPGSGIDLTHFAATDYPPESDAPVFLMIARLLRDKGVLEYVAAARNVKSDHPHARFQILGAVDAANRTAIDAATVKSWQEEGVIEYLGTADDVRPHIAAAHCVVLPSYREGAPRTLIEAAAMARPLIATDVPGCRSVVDDGETGYLCKVRDGNDLAKSMDTFLALPHAEKAKMGLAGRAKMAAHFDQAIVVEAYRNALASAPSPFKQRITQ